MRRVAPIVLATALLFGAACNEAAEVVDETGDAVSEAISEGADTIEDGIDLAQFCVDAAQAAQAVRDGDHDRALNQAQDAFENAPDDIRPEVAKLIEGAERFAEGDRSVANDPEVQAAIEEVEDFTRERCDPR